MAATSMLLVLVAIFLSWVITSIPLYLAAKFVTGRKATFLKAMMASFIGFVFIGISEIIFGLILFPFGIAISMLISLLILSLIYGTIFDTGIVGGFLIAVISFIISLVLLFIFAAIFGVAFSLVQPGRHMIGNGLFQVGAVFLT